MNILYYYWRENSAQDMVATFKELGHTVSVVDDISFSDYLNDIEFEGLFEKKLCDKVYDFIYTFNYFPILSKIANKHNIKYVCWVYDCPHLTLYSTTITNPCNYLFVFDKDLADIAIANGAKNVFHLPLAANFRRNAIQLSIDGSELASFIPQNYQADISFVGSLYEKNMFRQINYLPDYVSGYLSGIMNSQKQLWGVDLISELMTEKIVGELEKYIRIESNPDYTYTSKEIFTSMVQKEITAQERIEAVNLLADYFSFVLYSGSAKEICPKAVYGGCVSYLTEMPVVFRTSKINLNVSLRSITSGIPLRCLDILACGGFLLTNYQPELVEGLNPGEDFVLYESMDDMLQKADYYLAHDKEREEIAYNGYKRAEKLFSYVAQTEKMLKSLCEI